MTQMTQMPQSGRSSEATSRDPRGEKAAPAFQAYLPSQAPRKKSRTPLVVMILAAVLLIAGLLFWSVEPKEARGKKARPDFGEMTAEQLAENAGSSAAAELVRRMLHGTPAEQAAASSVMNNPPSPRLARNLAMAMALEQKERADNMRVRMERDMRMAQEGY